MWHEWAEKKAYGLLVSKPEAMDLGEVGWGDVDWIGLTKDRNR
jgi:hypothetical protein